MARHTVTLLVLALLAGSCGRMLGDRNCADARFVIANPGGLRCLDRDGRPSGTLVALPALTAPMSPSRQATTGKIFFTMTAVQDNKTGFGSDLMSVAADGSDLRVVLAHESDSVFYDFPSLDRTGTVLYFLRSAKLIRDNAYVGTESAIERLDLGSGQRAVIVRNAADPTISGDGQTLVYVRRLDGDPDGLWLTDPTGANPRALLPLHSFTQIQTPRFAPDDEWIAFSAAGHLAPANGRMPHFAHLGIPSELFIVRRDGTGLRALVTTPDDIIPSWSPDAASILFVSGGRLVVVDVATASSRTMASTLRFPSGEVLWLR